MAPRPRAAYPWAVIIVFDADCGVCQASVAWAKKRDRRGALQFVGNDVAELPPGVSREETGHTVIVLDGPRKLVRAAAVARILSELGGWAVAGAVLRAPGIRRLADWGYDRFAENRHRVSAALGMRVCEVPGKKAWSHGSARTPAALRDSRRDPAPR
jgi:predicted DCC family thiol-disulfide oxidoreductase YuxK